MAASIALVGGNEFRPECEEMDRAILDATGSRQASVLIVPTAAATENPARAASNGVSYFTDLGAEAAALMVLEPSQANDEGLVAAVDDANLVYFTGGSPTHLLDVLGDSLLLRKIRGAIDGETVLAGSSAGAMVLGSWMLFGGWEPALGVVPGVATLPHHERSNPEKVAEQMAQSAPSGVTAIGVDGGTGCLLGPEGVRVLGAGHVTVYEGGGLRRFGPGETFELGCTQTS